MKALIVDGYNAIHKIKHLQHMIDKGYAGNNRVLKKAIGIKVNYG